MCTGRHGEACYGTHLNKVIPDLHHLTGEHQGGALFPIMIAGACVLLLIMVGMIEASITRASVAAASPS